MESVCLKLLIYLSLDKIEKELGKGAFGTVFLVEDIKDGKKYAMKEIKLNLPKVVEQEIANKLKNNCDCPNIVPIYDSFTEGPNQYIIMEHCEGGPLSKYINDMKGGRIYNNETV
jgi:serine/threonine protein kinase